MLQATKLDVDALRADTPGCDHVLHFNNAGAGLMPQPVLDALLGHLTREALIGGYEAHTAAKDEYQDTYRALEALLGAKKGEVALLENATRAWDQVFYGMDFKPGDRVITANASYASNYIAMLQQQKRHGIEIDVIGNDSHGQVDVETLKRTIGPRTRLICLTHIPTNGGLVNPAAEVGRIARKHNVPYLLDACQSVGQVEVDVDAIGCDFLSGTGRKYLRGPRGTGFLYVRSESLDLIEPPFLDLRAADWVSRNEYRMADGAARFENWEGFVAGKIALGAAVRYLLKLGPDLIFKRIAEVAAHLRTELSSVSGITVQDIGLRKGGIVTFSHESVDARTIRDRLSEEDINAHFLVPKWSRLDSEMRHLPNMIRASVHAYNSEEEVGRFVESVKTIVA
ncbi:MAG: aminotransferase class V-fold PLP-dependent enzyme [Bacteroidetes bacterium]|nr:aminotransferase class V-fold PLP-dependent enzyme [Bacteroidota bacterium]MDA1333369.1 aminotransferase class V-fold PLP-dependent enzyme [Bacteroidota bacterium]